jgi:hypothetical protein
VTRAVIPGGGGGGALSVYHPLPCGPDRAMSLCRWGLIENDAMGVKRTLFESDDRERGFEGTEFYRPQNTRRLQGGSQACSVSKDLECRFGVTLL